eukprot:CAMPEP_0178981054 /NCGR_PEP_ID=MMETSP0789-20121207/26843_1 /TAXON_ID=3005 /ORGANISM="Rhizosolenia setigera, Strain CCMP 1694" /LENGTH=466 /DNA_ID=CAMNT_0020671545 /DNA_START=60 /DNA_END=1457 /DNA_ORIENTATION=-
MKSLAFRLRIAAVYALLSTSLTLARNPKKGVSFSGAQSCKSLEVHTDSSWWYTWGTNAGFAGNLRNFCQNDNGAAAAAARADGMDFVPMFWNSVPSTIDAELQAELEAATYLMTFNEPERGDQANLTPAQAAALWPQIENIADTYGLSIVGPCMTKDAYDWYDDFLAACTNCRIDYTCIHTYYQPWPCDGSKDWECIGNADLGNDYWLRVTLDRWFDDYGKPIWVTEYGCYPWDAAGEGCDANKHSAILEQQTSVFEEDSRVFRYNWFTTYAFDEGGFKDGALNVPNYEEVGPGQACPNIKWIAGIFETRGWGIHEYHECVTIADNDVECHKPVRLSIDDESCYCSRDSCDTTVSSYGAMDTYKELELLPSRDESELSDMGDEYNDFGSVVSSVPSLLPTFEPSTNFQEEESISPTKTNKPSNLLSDSPSSTPSFDSNVGCRDSTALVSVLIESMKPKVIVSYGFW